jgi:N-succinyldiaminopimelate aminotransferase
MAVGLALPDSYFDGLAAELQLARDHLVTGLQKAGFDTPVPEATYFVTVDIRPVDPSGEGMAFCRSLPERCGVVAVPNEVFYMRREHGRHLVRFACCKQLDVIDAAAQKLADGFGS